MPRRWRADDEYQIIHDLVDAQRGHGVALAASQLPTWAHDRFVVAGTPLTTYQLTSIPYGINVLSKTASGGTTSLVLAEGTDYTVDYSTGIVTLTATPAAADVIFVSYVTTGDLIAASLPPDTGGGADNFNRANSATLGTASDGHSVWTQRNGVIGIGTNRAVVTTAAATGETVATVPAQADATFQVDVAVIPAATNVGVAFRWQAVDQYFYYWCDSAGNVRLYRVVTGGSSVTVWAGVNIGAGATPTLKVVTSGSNIDLYINGTFQTTVADSNYATATQAGLDMYDFFLAGAAADNFSWAT